MRPKTKIPLVFDLDGTLIDGDCLGEAILETAAKRPWELVGAAIAFLNHGKPGLKTHLAERCEIGARGIPPNTAAVALLTEELENGRKCVLATASPGKWAQEINALMGGPFEEVLATTKHNLKGPAKASALEDRFGKKGFDYVGNSTADIPVWKAARKGYLAGGSRKTGRAARAAGLDLEELETDRPRAQMRDVLRTHQWPKNLLVLIPMLAAHKYNDPWTVAIGAATLIAFCLVASGNYILNDLSDAPTDRRHPTKCARPVARGLVLIPEALGLAAILIGAGFAISITINPMVGATLALYVIAAFTYSHWAKSVAILDALVLAGLYCLRLWAGGLATETPVSFWLLSASLFLFFSLALGKRDAELSAHQKADGRGYRHTDRMSLAGIGTASSIGAAFMLCLYIQSPEAAVYYKHNPFLWVLPATCLYWAGRFWLICGRGEMTEDPIIWAARDRGTWACVAVVLVALLCAHLING